MKLSIIIPAYNEEDAIESIIRRTLDARNAIVENTSVDEVEIIVVSDGSTDSTILIAKKFVPQITLIAYPKNRGYGRAIKIGFENSTAELVSFLDADGTCDPLLFIEMVNQLEKENADICVGSRMGATSKMPKTRRVGNIIFSTLINSIANADISDSASGMRIIRKDKLIQLYPLPDGLHFTPAMSCRAVLDAHLKIIEVNIPYEERQGKSKLSVIQDGIRFLKVIISIALTYRPLKILGSVGILLITISFVYGMAILGFYVREGYIREGEIHRLVSVMVFGVGGILLLGLARLTDKAAKLYNNDFKGTGTIIGKVVRWIFSWRTLRFTSPLLFMSGVILNYQSIISWVTTRKISTHWSYIVIGGYLVLLGIVGFTFAVIDYLLDLIDEKTQMTHPE